MLTIPNLCLIGILVILVAQACIVVALDSGRPKPFDFEGWDNGRVTPCDSPSTSTTP